MKKTYMILAAYLIFCGQIANANITLKMTTFNVKWFGLGGEISANKSDEYRTPWLTEFIDNHLASQDIIVFQEITDFPKLQEIMSKFSMNCYSYDHDRSNHQKVVLCLNSLYRFSAPDQDNNILIEDVAEVNKGGLRPAVHGIVSHAKTNKKLAYVIGVHLKASTLYSRTRLNQIEIIKNEIKKERISLPTIVLGDFNTFTKEQTNNEKDDAEYIQDIFSQVNLDHVQHGFKNTFKSGGLSQLFDHAWVSKDVKVEDVQVWKSCNAYSSNSKRFDNISFYNRFVSDHCPLSFTVTSEVAQ